MKMISRSALLCRRLLYILFLQSLKRLSANFCFPDLASGSAGTDCSQFVLCRIDDFPKNVKVTSPYGFGKLGQSSSLLHLLHDHHDHDHDHPHEALCCSLFFYE